jgi:hypothetical protein
MSSAILFRGLSIPTSRLHVRVYRPSGQAGLRECRIAGAQECGGPVSVVGITGLFGATLSSASRIILGSK